MMDEKKEFSESDLEILKKDSEKSDKHFLKQEVKETSEEDS